MNEMVILKLFIIISVSLLLIMIISLIKLNLLFKKDKIDTEIRKKEEQE